MTPQPLPPAFALLETEPNAAADADTEHWKFLTGPQQDIWNLATIGFRLPVGEENKNAQIPIFHSQKFVLVDSLGLVRGFYDALEQAGQQQLLDDLSRVIHETSNLSPPPRISSPENKRLTPEDGDS